MKEKLFTNCFLVKTDVDGKPAEVCLAMKKRGFGEGMWNGAGGKQEEGETIEDAALREVCEEFRVLDVQLDKRAEIEFVLVEDDKKIVMYAFLAGSWRGEPEETEEMNPKWFKIDEVPYEEMWKGDREWLPLILSGKKIKAQYIYEREGGEVKTRQIEEVADFC